MHMHIYIRPYSLCKAVSDNYGIIPQNHLEEFSRNTTNRLHKETNTIVLPKEK